MGTLAVLVVVFTASGIHSNAQIEQLHEHGVPVTVTVTHCLGLLGGTGTQPAGYVCHGTYSLGSARYTESLPGLDFYRPGAKVAAIAVPGDPALVSPVRVLATQHSSASVFVLPALLLTSLLAISGLLLFRRMDRRRAA